MFYFSNNEIIFDYKIKKANLYVFNAIKTLEKMGFPELLIKEVEKIFVGLEKRQSAIGKGCTTCLL